jgi:hypothetical protein
MKINPVSNGIPVSEGPNNDICCVNAWLREELWEVKNQYYTHKVDHFSDFNGEFTRNSINEFIDSLTSTGKYTQIVVSYVSAN